MLTYFKRLMTDEGRFVSVMRGVLMAGSAAVATGDLPLPAWAAAVAAGLAGTLRSNASKPGDDAA